MTTWRKEIQDAMDKNKDSFDNFVECCITDDVGSKKEFGRYSNDGILTISLDWLDIEFYDGYGTSEGLPFVLWTEKYVYFPCVYDGSEWVESVPRSPTATKVEHFGGQ